MSGAGVNAVWTPATGKKFRLMGWSLQSSVSGAVLTIHDGAPAILYVGVTAVESVNSPPGLGNGYLSTAANNALGISHANGTVVRGFVFGTEE